MYDIPALCLDFPLSLPILPGPPVSPLSAGEALAHILAPRLLATALVLLCLSSSLFLFVNCYTCYTLVLAPCLRRHLDAVVSVPDALTLRPPLALHDSEEENHRKKSRQL